ncbi:glycosyltransferase involved in cell wall biosynthesis [Salinibacter ruber]|uniref:glycosyltransferase family 4 protein n=1 Tax=Salinibacter ruber TaxID=146919 RepID=UPI002169C31C|nr:glycosyltransferase family 4 protein [Salinibacter ruber]MCS4047508.1 glycosyltransferase involved in cell wall biosynthesis [Salinibacter ruber]
MASVEASSPSWIVAQIEAREHYAVPRVLHREGVLEHLYTDAWCRWGRNLLRHAPDPLRSLANRYHPSIPSRRVTAYTGWAIAHRLRYWWKGAPSDSARYERFLEKGRGFGERVREALQGADWKEEGLVFFGYDTGSLEPLRFLEATNCFTIVDQMDPGRVEKELVLEEIQRWPGWAASAPVLYEPYQERRRTEWEQADAVVVNSEWSKEALTHQGIGEEKIHVVPLAYDASGMEPNLDGRFTREGPLRVLWLGRVNLRKGIQYLVEAAKQLEGDSLEFDVVGPVKITEEMVAQAPSNMTFHGRVPRDEVNDYYRNAEVFVLPTLSDGFAITQLEAMAHGLPVVTTPNCGRVVTDGEDGWIIPPRDSDALAETLAFCAGHRSQLRRMAERAHATSKQYTLGRVADALRSIPPAT